MSLHVLGINHQTAPVSLRERLAFDAESLPAALMDEVVAAAAERFE